MNRGLVLIALFLCVTAPTNVFADGISESSLAIADEQRTSLGGGAATQDDGAPKRAARLEKASQGQQDIAIGHFARTRSLLAATLNEFDAGVAKADPSSLIDTAMFREGLKARARELDRILDPQPRESESGVKYSADTRLLSRK